MTDRIRLKLMADYHAFPVWYVDHCMGTSVSPDLLGLSASLAHDLQAWSDEYTEAMYAAPSLDSPKAATLADSCDGRGRALLVRLREELAGGYVVGYVDDANARIEWPDEEDPGPSRTP
jgi:hypothetical protein